MRIRIFISEVDEHGGEWKAGNQRGYDEPLKAFKVAKRLANKTGRTYCVAEYAVQGEERDCVEVLGYEYPKENQVSDKTSVC